MAAFQNVVAPTSKPVKGQSVRNLISMELLIIRAARAAGLEPEDQVVDAQISGQGTGR